MSLIGNKEPAHATDVVPGPEKLDRPRVPLPSTRRMLTDEDLNTLQRSPRELVAEVDRLRLHLCVGVCMHVSVSVSVCDSLARARARSLSLSLYMSTCICTYTIYYMRWIACAYSCRWRETPMEMSMDTRNCRRMVTSERACPFRKHRCPVHTPTADRLCMRQPTKARGPQAYKSRC